MKNHRSKRGMGTAVAAALLFGAIIVGSAGCSGDSSPVLFSPPTSSGPEGSAPLLVVPSLLKMTKIAGNETDYNIHIDLWQAGSNTVQLPTQRRIADCAISVLYNDQVVLPDTSLMKEDGTSACQVGRTEVAIGILAVGTREQTGTLTFTVSMFDPDHALIVQGATIPCPVMPGKIMSVNLMASEVAR